VKKSPFFIGSTEEFQNERLKEASSGGFLAIAMPTWRFGQFSKYSEN
jgi:hypothetical protein